MVEETGYLRLFFALWPEPPIRRALARSTKAPVRAAGGRVVPRENLHITLAFLGSVPRGQVDTFKSAAAGVGQQPFDLVLDRLGFFQRARSLWLGPSAVCPGLLALEQSLRQALEAVGWQREARPFMPHVTLVRKANQVANPGSVKPVIWSVGHFSLIESVTDQRGAVYRELTRWALVAG